MSRAKARAPGAPPKAGPGKSRRPIMALLDLLGRRWTLRILWELRGVPLTSRALRAACDDVSPTVLQARIHELREAGIVERTGEGYGLTPLGRELLVAFNPLLDFAKKWAKCTSAEVRSSSHELR